MRPLNDDAYVLRTQPLGESDWIVSLLSREHGLVRGVARGARRSRKRFAGLLQPLNEVAASWVEKPGRDLHRLEGVEARTDWSEIQSEPSIQALCAILSEVTEAFSHEGQAEVDVYRLLGATLRAVDDERSPWLLLRYYEYWMLKLHGLLDRFDRCGRCGDDVGTTPLVIDNRGLMCRECQASMGQSGRPLGQEVRMILNTFRSSAPGALVGEDRLARPGSVMESLLRGTLEGFAERRFRSYRHLASLESPEEYPR